MEPEGSLPHSQVPATCPYPDPARSSPYPHIPLPEQPSYYYPPIYAWVSQVVSFPQVSPPKPCTSLSSPPYALHAPPVSFFSILSPDLQHNIKQKLRTNVAQISSAAFPVIWTLPYPFVDVCLSVCCECCVLSGRGLCDGLITRPEESYRLWCVIVCDLETSRMRGPWPALGRSSTEGGGIQYDCSYRMYQAIKICFPGMSNSARSLYSPFCKEILKWFHTNTTRTD